MRLPSGGRVVFRFARASSQRASTTLEKVASAFKCGPVESVSTVEDLARKLSSPTEAKTTRCLLHTVTEYERLEKLRRLLLSRQVRSPCPPCSSHGTMVCWCTADCSTVRCAQIGLNGTVVVFDIPVLDNIAGEWVADSWPRAICYFQRDSQLTELKALMSSPASGLLSLGTCFVSLFQFFSGPSTAWLLFALSCPSVQLFCSPLTSPLSDVRSTLLHQKARRSRPRRSSCDPGCSFGTCPCPRSAR
jgi:hypothetical protein